VACSCTCTPRCRRAKGGCANKGIRYSKGKMDVCANCIYVCVKESSIYALASLLFWWFTFLLLFHLCCSCLVYQSLVSKWILFFFSGFDGLEEILFELHKGSPLVPILHKRRELLVEVKTLCDPVVINHFNLGFNYLILLLCQKDFTVGVGSSRFWC